MTRQQHNLLVGKTDLKVAFLSSYPPRECGIATFTKPLERVLNELYLSSPAQVLAVNDEPYNYNKNVAFTIDAFKRASFKTAANFVNKSQIEVVNVQHEYGLYGGEAGEFLLDFYLNVKKPIVTTFHSVVPKHSPKRAWVTQKIIDNSATIVVMTEFAKEMLMEIFHIDDEKIEIIPHGVPNVRPNLKAQAKQKLGFANRTLLTTFGLINPGKGIEFGIQAMVEVVKHYPNVIYLILGKTHPVLLRNEGESYRRKLEGLVKDFGLGKNIKFVNRYLDYNNLVDYLIATDVYLMLQVDPYQAFSGTTAYALGCGTPVIGTPTPYNREVLADGRGQLVPFEDEYSVRKQILKLLNKPSLSDDMAMRAYRYGRDMIWPRVGLDYLKVFDLAILKKDL